MNKRIKKRLIALLLSINTLLVGCGNNVNCDVKEKHMHVYTSEEGLKRYVSGEHEYVSFDGETYYRTEEYESLDKDEVNYYKLISDNNLVNINDNLDLLQRITSSLRDYYIFEYYSINTSNYTDRSESSYKIVEEEHEKITKDYYWTENPNVSNLTGKYSVNTHVYYGYNVVKNNKGKYVLQKSGPVNDFNLLIQMGYPQT